MFPLKTSPFAYNESTSYEYYPLSKDEVLARGWKWKEEEKVDKVDTPYAPQPTEAYDETKVGEQQARENIQKCLEGTLECSVT